MEEKGDTDWTGGCLCGAVRYRATAGPLRAVTCHCGLCRRASGAPFLTFAHFAKHAFSWTKGAPALWQSSAHAGRGFCAACGAVLMMHEDVLGDRVQVTLGSLDRPEDVTPDDHVWTESQLSWLTIVDDQPRYPRISKAVPSRALDDD